MRRSTIRRGVRQRCSAAQRMPACRLSPWALAHRCCVIGAARLAAALGLRPRPGLHETPEPPARDIAIGY